MEHKTSIKNCLCKTYRAAGLPKDKALALTNQVDKWIRSSGIEWTVERMKSLHHWYITQLGDVPNIPSWVSHKGGKPKGPFKWVFEMKNRQCALAILSSHTIFYNTRVTPVQMAKLKTSLQSPVVSIVLKGRNDLRAFPKLKYSSPTLQCLTGSSIPVGHQKIRLQDPSIGDVVNAYVRSWDNIPEETLQFIQDAGLSDHAPPSVIRYSGKSMGTLSCIQEPSLKARWISNPNRITEHFLVPLGKEWFQQLQDFSTDCTLDQTRGVRWAQEGLKMGRTLAAADLESATDKLNLEPCLGFVHRFLYGSTEVDHIGQSGKGLDPYLLAVKHFYDVSRGSWLLGGEKMKWEVGWPLGTRPSFPLLGLVNNLCAGFAASKLKIPQADAFRVLGDDIIMDARILPEYTKNIEALGGKINPSKSIVSNQAVEFAGQVIDKHGSYLKRVKAREISDVNYMQLMSLMGEQAKWLLKKRQKRTWDELKYVPGVAVDGHHSRDSFGEPLADRYFWYLKHVANPKVKADPINQSGDQMALSVVLSYEDRYSSLGITKDHWKFFVPRDIWSGIQPDKTAYLNVKTSGDPRLESGLTSLQVAESILEKDTFKPYQTFKTEDLGKDSESVVKPKPSKPSRPNRRKGRR